MLLVEFLEKNVYETSEAPVIRNIDTSGWKHRLAGMSSPKSPTGSQFVLQSDDVDEVPEPAKLTLPVAVAVPVVTKVNFGNPPEDVAGKVYQYVDTLSSG